MIQYFDYATILKSELTEKKRTLLTLKGFKEPKDFDKKKAKLTIRLTINRLINCGDTYVCHALSDSAEKTQIDIESFKYLIKVIFCLSPTSYLQSKQNVWYITGEYIPSCILPSQARNYRIEILTAASILLHNSKLITQPKIQKTRSKLDALNAVME